MKAVRLSAAILVSALSCMLGAVQSSASTDQGCFPAIKALSSVFNCDVSAMLIPENDTRDNLRFLFTDRQKQKLDTWPQQTIADGTEDYAHGESTICVSAESGSAAFQSAVTADATIPATEMAQLIAARLQLTCGGGDTSPPLPIIAAQSEHGRAFSDYLKAIERFYRTDHTDASNFIALANTKQPWVREAASYMQARTWLLASQVNAAGEYGDFDPTKANQTIAAEARDGLNAYLRDYPDGSYAVSAKGLLRRAAWFLNQPDVLAIIYGTALAESVSDEAVVEMANEIDLKLPLASYTDPKADLLFLVVQDLRLLRVRVDDDGKPIHVMDASFLEAQRSRFAGQERLFDYLLALRALLVDKDAKSVLALISDPAPTVDLDYTAFSRLMLRAAALNAMGDKTERDLYFAMLPFAKQFYQRTTIELELAKFEERNKNISAMFAEGSPITDPDIRNTLLNLVAGPIILKQQATSATAPQAERENAIYRLLARDLTQGRFKGFAEDIKLLPPKPQPDADGAVYDRFETFRWPGGTDDDYTCPAITEIAARMASNPKDVQVRICLGEFYRLAYIEETDVESPDDLGGSGTLFAGERIAQQDFYRDIMKDRNASRRDRAYALFRAVKCYAPLGNNSCGGSDVSKSMRKAWYAELKAKYADINWAQKLQYFW